MGKKRWIWITGSMRSRICWEKNRDGEDSKVTRDEANDGYRYMALPQHKKLPQPPEGSMF